DERPAFLEEQKRFARIADYHAHDAVVDRIADGESIDVNLRFAQRVTNAGKHAGPIFYKQGKLAGDVHSSYPLRTSLSQALAQLKSTNLEDLPPRWTASHDCGTMRLFDEASASLHHKRCKACFFTSVSFLAEARVYQLR